MSEPGDNLTFSLLLRPDRLPAREIMSITFLAAVVIRDWLREEGVPALVKWPNDLYVGNRKICGMLIENGFAEGMVAWSVIGIGINLNQTRFPGEDLVIERNAKTFEEAVTEAVDAMKEKIVRAKEKRFDK